MNKFIRIRLCFIEVDVNGHIEFSSRSPLHFSWLAIPREARGFGLGETKYYIIMVWSAIIWQGFFLGAIGVIFCASSLLSGIVITVLLPVTEVLAVIFYHEKFQAEKGVSLVLSLWGFASYFYGEIKQDKKKKKQQLQDTVSSPLKSPGRDIALVVAH
ncbi:hypothetical protein LIER_07835 [Lithospermum erythrorhizon]|uniref:Purine permease 3 n=1 Tax=Lithospermum erythrorhizon TaxID=34254 RepID=A0AAV3PCE8_LITER